jgi:hypothetical protein
MTSRITSALGVIGPDEKQSLPRGNTTMPPDPERLGPIVIQGRQLRCTVCSHDVFWEQEVQFATPITDLLDPGAWNRNAQCAVCERCGYVHMFIAPGTFKQTEESPDSQPQPRSA